MSAGQQYTVQQDQHLRIACAIERFCGTLAERSHGVTSRRIWAWGMLRGVGLVYNVKTHDSAAPPAESASAAPGTNGLLRKQRDWWDYRLWRAGKTVFFTPLPYRIISFFRRWAYDIIALVPLAAAGAWWITVSSGTIVPSASVSTIDPLQQLLLSHHVSRFYPTLIGFLLCVFILRTGRTATPRRSQAKVSLAGRISVSSIIFLLLLAVLDLILVPGSIAERAVPCLVAAVWGWLVRSVYGRVRVLEPTDAGFRPRARIALSRKSRKFARTCLTSSWRYGKRMATERAGIDSAIDYFASRGDARTLGWCVARGVDYNLRASALDEAEALLGRLDRYRKYRKLNDDPCARAAKGLFERATGTGAAGPIFADAERLCGGKSRRVPHRLRTLLAESEMSWSGDGDRRIRRWTGRTRVSLAWKREYATVLQDLLAASFTLERRDPQFAMVSVMRVEQLVNALGKESARSDLTVQEANSLQLVKAAARERIGELHAAQQRFREASASYAMAATLYRQTKYRPRAGFAAVRAAILALRAGVAEDAKAESDLLDALLTGLQSMEYDRGRLRDPQYRSGLLAARDTLYSDVFAALADCVTTNRAKAAELALWLLESVHRNALAENIQASQEPGASSESGEALRRLREPADVSGIRQVVTGRAALYYRCERSGNGWQVTTVLIAPSGVTLHRVLLPVAAPGTGRVTAMRKLPAALLDELASGDPGRVSFVHTNIRLGSPVWASLSQALLPSELADVLHSLESRRGPAILLIVPDGPLSSVPFAGLRLDDGSAVADHAAVVFMPNLLAFSANEWVREAEDPDCVTVAHFGPTMFKDAFDRLRSAPEFEPVPMTVRAAPDRESFVSALAQAPPPRIAVISHHGETAADPADRFINFVGGGKLSEQDAEHIGWPQTVVLGSCWASDITVRAGDDPLGLPTACLLGGASAVLGGQSRVDNDETSAQILARVTLEAALGRHPALTLRNAIRDHLAIRPADRDAPPAQWANMTVWTSQAPAGPVPVAPRWASWTTKLTARPPGEDRFAAFDLALLTKDRADRRKTRPLSVPIGGVLRRAIQHASGNGAPLSSVTSLDLLAAIFATDNADWTSFIVAADLPALPRTASHAGSTSRERDTASSVITLDLDHQAQVTAAVSRALGWGERLAAHLGDPVIAPAHMVYGFLCEDSCDAARWMSVNSHDISELRSLLGDRVFDTDLPPAADLPAAQSKPSTSRLVRPRVMKYSSPRTSGEVLDLMSADASGGRKVLSTLDFLGSVAAANGAAWRQLTEAGFRLSPPDLAPFAERDRGGREISLGDGYLATVTQEFAEAFRRARSLAYHLGDPEIGSAHMLYGLLTDQGNDAARWLRSAESLPRAQAADGEAVTVLAERVFRSPLPLSHRLPAAPPPPGPKSPSWMLLLVPPLLLGMLLVRIRRKARGSLAMWVLLGILIVTMGLADINTSAPNSTQLVVERTALTGTVSLAGQASGEPVPSTLLGSLSTFYASPVIQGWRNDIRATFSSWGHSPAALSGWYLFVLPAPPHPPAASVGWLSYRGARYRARVTCQGQIAQTACFALVQLPGSVAPSGFSWGTESYSGVSPGTDASQTALVYQGTGQTVGQAAIEIYAETSGGSDILKVSDKTGQPIRPDSPVVLDDRSRVLPLFGIAIPAESGPWDAVYPLDLLDPYAEEIADKLAGPMPGAQAYAGVELSAVPGDPQGPALISEVLIGSPADDAGIQTDDEILSIDGEAVNGPSDVTDILSAHRPGQTVDVEILRKHTRGYVRLTIVLTLGYRPT
jgi:CHAT domain/PDZ domain/Clp amino terminal domain, pathogenicity island component